MINFQLVNIFISNLSSYLVCGHHSEVVRSLLLVVQLILQTELPGGGLDAELVPNVRLLPDAVADHGVEPAVWVCSSHLQEILDLNTDGWER